MLSTYLKCYTISPILFPLRSYKTYDIFFLYPFELNSFLFVLLLYVFKLNSMYNLFLERIFSIKDIYNKEEILKRKKELTNNTITSFECTFKSNVRHKPHLLAEYTHK